MKKRPELTQHTTVSEFEDFYWLKKELVIFCRAHDISADGGKIAIADRIKLFLTTGIKIQPTSRTACKITYDSDKGISHNTPVIYYKNDAKTRSFFVSQIGKKFKFNPYLRSFAKKQNSGELTYGDLVKGYQESLRNPNKTIDKQFEYNQFQRDFYKNNPKKSRTECNQAWQLIKQAPGGSTYKTILI